MICTAAIFNTKNITMSMCLSTMPCEHMWQVEIRLYTSETLGLNGDSGQLCVPAALLSGGINGKIIAPAGN
jgi:hypothetical protein